MAPEIFRFENLQVYQRVRGLVSKIYRLTNKWPRDYLFDVTSQLRRAILSVLLNIAEGSGRTKGDFARFLNMAIGSCKECVALFEVARDLNLLSEGEEQELRKEITEVVMMLEGLKKSLR